jgi:hypothetical protein
MLRFYTPGTAGELIEVKKGLSEQHMQEQLSYEKRLEIAAHLCERSLYPDKVVTLSDTRALGWRKIVGMFNLPVVRIN